MTTRFAVIPAVYLYLKRPDDGRVLLQKRKNVAFMNNKWAAGAAGHVEAGESLAAAMLREAKEELGLTLDEQCLEPAFSALRTDGTDNALSQRVDFVYVCTQWTSVPAIMEPEKCSALDWFNPAELPDDVSPYERPFIERLRVDEPTGGLAFFSSTYLT